MAGGGTHAPFTAIDAKFVGPVITLSCDRYAPKSKLQVSITSRVLAPPTETKASWEASKVVPRLDIATPEI